MHRTMAIGAVLLLAITVLLARDPQPDSPAGAEATRLPPRMATAEPSETAASTAPPPETVPVESEPQLIGGEALPILGQKVRLREIRDADSGELQNLEFVFRQGILPRRLFADGRRILRYDELHRNSVGYGASTAWMLYQVASEDGVEVAVSRPDGSDYQVLGSGLQAVFDFEHFPAENTLEVEVQRRGRAIREVYVLPSR